MHTRPIPSSGAALPVIGCGTWRGFDVGRRPEEKPARAEVLQALFDAGGSVVDSSPMYGTAEAVVGELLQAANTRQRAFVATKVWTSGRQAGVEQMERSMALLRTSRIDLMQVHNLVDSRTHLATLREWKAQGRVSYIGVTHYTESAFGELEAVMRAESPDFVQLNYSIEQRTAADRLLPLAAERGRGAGEPAVRRRQGAQRTADPAATRVGGGDRLRDMEPGVAEIRAVATRRDLRDSRHLECAAHAGQREGRRGRDPATRVLGRQVAAALIAAPRSLELGQ
jgi:aryl-alcohol dehydrogenase-like predicted oxidoreductase